MAVPGACAGRNCAQAGAPIYKTAGDYSKWASAEHPARGVRNASGETPAAIWVIEGAKAAFDGAVFVVAVCEGLGVYGGRQEGGRRWKGKVLSIFDKHMHLRSCF